jgi:hypothetical protein
MSDPAVHIAAWEAGGLIDPQLAERLRQASALVDEAVADPGVLEPDSAASPPPLQPEASPTSIGSFFGPTVTVGEMFGYLGVSFLIGAWSAFLVRLATDSDRDAIVTSGTGFAAIVLAAIAVVLMRGDARRRRAAGIAFLVATTLVATAAEFLAILLGLEGAVVAIVVAVLAVAAAALFRYLHSAVTTQVGLLATLTGLTAAVLSWLESLMVPGYGGFSGGSPIPIGVVLVAAVMWLATGLGFGVLGLFEADREPIDPGASRRAAVTRLWAGLVAVIGLVSSMTRSGYVNGEDRYGRLIEPWIGDIAILVLVAVLVERAFRRDSTAFVIAGAIGLIAALTDFNFTYLSKSTDLGLLIEGAILLAVGFAGDRVRRRLDRSGGSAPAVAPEPEVSPA